jgi:hypothetical protein
MRRLLGALLAALSLTLIACSEDCGSRRDRQEANRPHNQVKPSEPWAR